jgi:hypothetical protein
MDNGYIIDRPVYNSKNGLYDIILSTKNIISCYRILNCTNFTYSDIPGYFYISPDNKYIFILVCDITYIFFISTLLVQI